MATASKNLVMNVDHPQFDKTTEEFNELLTIKSNLFIAYTGDYFNLCLQLLERKVISGEEHESVCAGETHAQKVMRMIAIFRSKGFNAIPEISKSYRKTANAPHVPDLLDRFWNYNLVPRISSPDAVSGPISNCDNSQHIITAGPIMRILNILLQNGPRNHCDEVKQTSGPPLEIFSDGNALVITVDTSQALDFGYFGFFGDWMKKLIMNPEKPAEIADSSTFENEIGDLKKRFPKQTADTWIKISSAMRPMFDNEEPRRPAVLLLLTSETESTTFPVALATMLGKCWIADEQEKYCIFEGKDFQNRDISSIYSQLKGYVDTNHVIMFREMEKITRPEYLTVFHNLCDNSYATYKRICYILTITLSPEEFQQIKENPRHLEKQKSTLLHDKWSEVSVESRAALIARVSPFTIFVDDENKNLQSPAKVTHREVNEAGAQFASYGNWWYETAWGTYEAVRGLFFSTRRTKFNQFVTKSKNEYPSSNYNNKNVWDIITLSFENLVSSRQVYPTVLLLVLSSETRPNFLENLKFELEYVFDCLCTEEFDREKFEISLGSLDTETRYMLPDTTQGHICQDVHKLKRGQIKKLISIFPKENTGTFNNTYWIFTISNLAKEMSPDNCNQVIRNTLENSFDGLAESGDGEYLLERMLEFTIFV